MIRFLDLRINSEEEKKLLLKRIENVFDHGQFVLGPEVNEFERTIAGSVGKKYGIGVGSGTDALYLALRCLDIGPGDEVITTSLSWIATANAIKITGATPVFADIQDDLNIDPESIERLITPHTKAILPVHYTGKICNMDKIMQISEKYQIPVIEDASQAFGAAYKAKKAGSFGKLSCFSMNPMKVFAACGEAGCICTDDMECYDKLQALRYNGTVNKEICLYPSLNGRIDTIQAAILLHRIYQVEQIIEVRRDIASYYQSALHSLVKTPHEFPWERDVYYTYTIQTMDRDNLKTYLEKSGVETKIQHPILMPLQPPYSHCKRDIQNATRIVKNILCIPANEKITRKEQDTIIKLIKGFFT
jgi:dTDP-4-amino-4,6-dideoxygalactose transaminase